MKALTIEAYQNNLIRAMQGMKVSEVSLPEPARDELLVRVKLAPVNPSDIAFLRGGYAITRELPAIPGFEGTGTVIKSGPGVDPALEGRRVSFFVQGQWGTWAQYTVVPVSNCVMVHDELPDEQAACLFINPLTAAGLYEQIINGNHPAAILTAAGGQVGDFIRFFAAKQGIRIINLVRKDQQMADLQSRGEQYVLNITHEDFWDKLREVSSQLKATIAFDAIGGEFTGKLLNYLPHGSEVILFGGLSGQPVSATDPLEIIFYRKILRGFNLGDWLSSTDKNRLHVVTDEIQQHLISGQLKTRIQKIVPLENFYEGLRSYISAMSSGKVLFECT